MAGINVTTLEKMCPRKCAESISKMFGLVNNTFMQLYNAAS